MQSFLRSINNKYEYKQYLPNKTIKKKGTAKNINSDINGLTGESLQNKIYQILSTHKAEIEKCKAIIIEDDLDGRFYTYSESDIAAYNDNVIKNIHDKLNIALPVFIIYASPEIESWFIADWNNGFNYLYCESGIVTDLEKNITEFFVHHLKKYIDSKILYQYVNCIENFGYFNGEYIKLSDKLVDAIKNKHYIATLQNVNKDYQRKIMLSRSLYYSKRLHGDLMLRNIKPDIVAAKCRKYFHPIYNVLSQFNE